MESKANFQMATMIKFIPGECEAAIELYKKAFGAKVTFLMRWIEAGEHEAIKTEEDKQLIYHAQLDFNGQRYLLCDNVFDDLPRGHSLYLVASFKDKDNVKRAYDYMKEGATIISPYNFSDSNGADCALIDRFGIHWEIIVYDYDSQ